MRRYRPESEIDCKLIMLWLGPRHCDDSPIPVFVLDVSLGIEGQVGFERDVGIGLHRPG